MPKGSRKPRLRLTPAAIAKISYPKKGELRFQISDTETPSLKLRVNHASKSLDFVYRKNAGAKAGSLAWHWLGGDPDATDLSNVAIRELTDDMLEKRR